MQAIILIIVLIILACFSFFFSASETAIIGLSKIRLKHMLSKGIKHAQNIQHLISKIEKFLVGILVGNNFVNIAISAIITAACVQWFNYNWGVIIATFTTSLFILVICEITPKTLATKHAEKIALFSAPIMEVLIKILEPVIKIFIKINSLILKILRIPSVKRSPLVTEEELRLLIEVGKEEGILTEEERRMLHRIFEFGDIKIKDVMVPKDRMVAVNIDSTSDELLDIFLEQGHARLPVYKEKIENIIGIIYARDLLYILKNKGLFILQDLVHKPYYIQASLQVNELLKKFQADKLQIAVVVDGNNKTLGLVTLEDLIEEIVGEIEEVHVKHSKDK